jgi:MFS family permease
LKLPKNYILFWACQSVSQFGSAMTGYALILWAYGAEKSAMSVSLLSLFSYLPYLFAGPLAGMISGRWKSRTVLLAADAAAEVCTAAVLLLFAFGRLRVPMLYPVNFIESFMNAVQSPVANAAAGSLVPKEKFEKIGGMNSFSGSLISIAAPVFATSLLSLWGLWAVLLFDVASFLAAFFVLMFVVRLPERTGAREGGFRFSGEGFQFLRKERGLVFLFAAFAGMNFFSSVTYENILPAMLFSRTGGNERVVGAVSAAVGLGGFAGSLAVLFFRMPGDRIRTIFFCAAFSFLFGDLLMGFGRSEAAWIPAALAASVPVSLINSAETALVYEKVPDRLRERVFALKNAFQFSVKPAGYLLGGFLADFVFEPFLRTRTARNAWLAALVGSGGGSGMAAMFLCTGVLGSVLSAAFYPAVRGAFRREENASAGDKNIV